MFHSIALTLIRVESVFICFCCDFLFRLESNRNEVYRKSLAFFFLFYIEQHTKPDLNYRRNEF